MDLSKIDLKKEYDFIVKALKTLGLTTYESQTFLAVIYHDGSSAEIIADTAGIPRPSTYKVLETLEKKGLIKSIEGRPKIFKIESLERLEERYANQIGDLFSKLKMLKDLLTEKGVPELVYTIYGKTKVLNKIGEYIDQSESEILLSSPKLIEIKKNLSKNIKNAIQRNVKIIIITARTQRAAPNCEVHYRDQLIATDIVVDSKRALIADAELEACGYSDNPVLAEHLKHFIDFMLFKNN
jgi:sugar-specific transcriptional regulator TrmB